MSLDFDVSKVRNYQVVTTIIYPDGSKHWHPITNSLIWKTISIGMHEITEKNWKEFFHRVRLCELVLGPGVLRDFDKPSNHPDNYITPSEVFAHIGLRTNASSKTEAQFLKDIMFHVKDNATNSVNSAENIYNASNWANMTQEEFNKLWFKETEEKTS